MRRLLARWRSDRGAEFVEFALAFPLLLLVVLGIIDFGLMFQQYEVITNAAREGARVAVLPNYTAADAQARAQQYIDSSLITGGEVATINVGAPTATPIGANCMYTVTVTVTYPHQFLFLSGIGNYFGASFTSRPLTAQSTMRTEIVSGVCP